MLDSKTRATLKGIASTKETEVLIGQGGITEGVLAQIDMNLDAHELVKIGILANSETSAKDVIGNLAQVLNAEPVCAIGRKIILYRYSRKAKSHVLDVNKAIDGAKHQPKSKQNKTKRK